MSLSRSNKMKRSPLFFHFIHQSLTRSKVEAQNGISSRYVSWICVGTRSWRRLECERTGGCQTSSGLFLYKDTQD
jgi:hypothetical protein